MVEVLKGALHYFLNLDAHSEAFDSVAKSSANTLLVFVAMWGFKVSMCRKTTVWLGHSSACDHIYCIL